MRRDVSNKDKQW